MRCHQSADMPDIVGMFCTGRQFALPKRPQFLPAMTCRDRPALCGAEAKCSRNMPEVTPSICRERRAARSLSGDIQVIFRRPCCARRLCLPSRGDSVHSSRRKLGNSSDSKSCDLRVRHGGANPGRPVIRLAAFSSRARMNPGPDFPYLQLFASAAFAC